MDTTSSYTAGTTAPVKTRLTYSIIDDHDAGNNTNSHQNHPELIPGIPSYGHRSGVTSLVLDPTGDANAGILYSAGRDGNVVSWQLHLDKSSFVERNRILGTHQNDVLAEESYMYYHQEQQPAQEQSIHRQQLTHYSANSSHHSVMIPKANEIISSLHTSPVSNLSSSPTSPSSSLHPFSLSKPVSIRDSPSNHSHDSPASSFYNNNNSTFQHLPHHNLHNNFNSSSLSHKSKQHYHFQQHSNNHNNNMNSGFYQQKTLPSATVYQSSSYHGDWINDMKLHLDKRHLITCSSDRSVVITSIFSPFTRKRLGIHRDYVKCLALPRHGDWVASGGLDGNVHLWDIREGRGCISSWKNHNPKKIPLSDPQSVYSMTCDPQGNIVCVGSIDRRLRLWDPRTPKYLATLSGHTDQIRSILISDDGKWVLSASSDKTVKLWSIAKPMQCVSTFSQFEDSVLTLYSSHPTLETFYAGCKDGLVAKFWRKKQQKQIIPSMIDSARDDHNLSGMFRGMSFSSHSGTLKRRVVLESEENVECLALFKENHPVLSLEAILDEFVWAGTTDSTIHRWNDIPLNKVKVRLPGADYSNVTNDTIWVPSNSYLEQETEPSLNRHLSSEHLETRYSLANEVTFRSMQSSNLPFQFLTDYSLGLDDQDEDVVEEIKPVLTEPDSILPGTPQLIKFALLNDKVHVISLNAEAVIELWDILSCRKIKEITRLDLSSYMTNNTSKYNNTSSILPLQQNSNANHLKMGDILFSSLELAFEDIVEQNNTKTWHNGWCQISIKTGCLQVHLDDKRCLEAEIYLQDRVEDMNEESKANIGLWVVSYLFEYFGKTFLEKVWVPTPSATTNNTFATTPAVNTSQSIQGQEQSSSLSDEETKLKSITYQIDPKVHPPLNIPPNTMLTISLLETTDSCCFQDLYRACIQDFGNEQEITSTIRHFIPTWVYSHVLFKEPLPNLAYKVGFVLVPHPQDPSLPVLPPGQNKLTAPHSLKISKIIQYLVERMPIQPEKEMIDMICKIRQVTSPDQVHPKDWLEFVCHDQSVDSNWTLLSVKQLIWKSGGDVLFYYRRRHSFQI